MATLNKWIGKELQLLKNPRESVMLWVLLLLVLSILVGFILEFLFPPASVW